MYRNLFRAYKFFKFLKTIKILRMRRETKMDEGTLKMEWAMKHMPILKTIENRLRKEKPFKGVRISIACALKQKLQISHIYFMK